MTESKNLKYKSKNNTMCLCDQNYDNKFHITEGSPLFIETFFQKVFRVSSGSKKPHLNAVAPELVSNYGP
jgi:hypothetical protein